MTFDSLQRRIRCLESNSPAANAILHFEDGSTRAIRVRDPLGLYCDCVNLTGWKATPSATGPEPVGEYDAVMRLFAAAASIESKEVFLRNIFELARESVEAQKQI